MMIYTDSIMTTGQTDILMVRGDTLAFGIELYEDESEETPLSTDLTSAVFTCRNGSENGVVIFREKLGAGIRKSDEGKYTVRAAPADTAGLPEGAYYYDMKISLNSDVFTIMKGVIYIIGE